MPAKSVAVETCLPNDPQSSLELVRSCRMLPETEDSLHLVEPPQRGLLAGALGSSRSLPAKRSVWVRDPVLLAVALDVGDTVVPRLLLRRVTRPLAQLVPDVGGRGDASRGDRKLAALREDLICHRQLPARRVPGGRQLVQLGFEPRRRQTLPRRERRCGPAPRDVPAGVAS